MSEKLILQNDKDSGEPRIALERYAPELYRFLIRRLRGRPDAEDLLQSVYLRFLQTPNTDLVRQPRAYLYKIASNVVSEFNLRQKRDPIMYSSETASELSERANPSDVGKDVFSDQLALEEQLNRVLAQLPKTYRAVLLMRTRDGLSFSEIAARFGITEQSARKYLVRALAQCRNAEWKP